MRLALAMLAAGALAACTPFDPPNGAYGCALVTGGCPGGFYCAEDRRCWRDGSGPPLSVLAGQIGGQGFADGEGIAMRFAINYSRQATVDEAGMVYFADHDNQAIRRIDPALGMLTTLVPTSTVAPNPSLSSPTGVVAGPGDVLYVVEASGRRVRRLKLRSGELEMVAGSNQQMGSRDGPLGVGAFNNPTAAALVGTDQLFVTDTADGTVRVVNLSTGMLTTVAGIPGSFGMVDGTGSTARFQRPEAIVAIGQDLYVLDDGSAVRRVNASTLEVTTVAGSNNSGDQDGTGTMARFMADSLATDGSSLFVADDDNHVVRRITLPAAQVTTIAGQKNQRGHRDGISALFDDPSLIAFVKAQNALVVLDSIGTVRKVPLGSPVAEVSTIGGAPDGRGYLDATGTKARFDAPGGVAADAKAAYVLDVGNAVVRRLDLASGEVTTVAGTPGMQGSDDGPAPLARFHFYNGFFGGRWSEAVLDGAGGLLIADSGNCTIRRLDLASYMVRTVAGSPGQCGGGDGSGSFASFNRPTALAYHAATNMLYVADDNCAIRRLDVGAGAVTTVVATGGGNCGNTQRRDGPFLVATIGQVNGLALDGDKLYFGDRGGSPVIRRIDLGQGRVDTVAGSRTGSFDGDALQAEFRSFASLAMDGKGGLLIADAENATVRRFDIARQTVTTVIGVARQRGVFVGTPPRVNDPRGLALVPDGRALITTESSILALR